MTHAANAREFIHADFMLTNDAARRLYHDYAEGQPVLDYHSHLPPHEIAQNRRYRDLYEIWLEGDHYKWRAMRANGIDERYCTGNAPAYEKYWAWARTIPYTLRNPLYHWTHLELKRAFGIDDLLSETTARSIWDRAAERLQHDDMTVHGLLKQFNVVAVCTTDDPAHPLDDHQAIARSGCATRVFPTFRPDKCMSVDDPASFQAWLERLAATCDIDIRSLDDLLRALDRRHEDFHALGGRLSDHGLTCLPAEDCDETEAARIFDQALGGVAATSCERDRFASFMMLFLGRLDAQRGWTKQLHLGPLRNANSRMFERYGPDGGFDSIGDWSHARTMAAYFDRLDREGALPKTIVYNNNPADNYVFATMMGNFQDGSVPSKMQFGAGWWHLDQKDGIRWQLNALSQVGLLSRFVGMLTDSRSFLSFPRHEYFRRILCDLLGRELENGELPDEALVGEMVRNICYANARNYLGLEVPVN